MLNDIRFRQALSISLTREEINMVIYHGLGVPFQATALWAEKLYIIGTVGMVPQPVIAKNNLGNVVKEYPLSAEWAGGLHNEVQQLFWKN